MASLNEGRKGKKESKKEKGTKEENKDRWK